MEEAAELERQMRRVNGQAAQIKRACNGHGPLLGAVKRAAVMLSELRTAQLPPNLYYGLYNACFDALSVLEEYLRQAHRTHHLADVYEVVQYTGHVLPRLYLMITVGAAFLATGEAPAMEVLSDMLEMSRGVQHPLRGLFLRYYLGQRTAAFVTSVRTRAEAEFAVRFTITNFIEMNKLWVRFQHTGHSRDYKRREAERVQLQTIVGSSILRLAQCDALTLNVFKTEILPQILAQVVQCHDRLAQEYLLDVLVQAFPAEYHLETLEEYLQCVERVGVTNVLRSSMEVVARALKSQAETLAEARAAEETAEEPKATEEATEEATEKETATTKEANTTTDATETTETTTKETDTAETVETETVETETAETVETAEATNETDTAAETTETETAETVETAEATETVETKKETQPIAAEIKTTIAEADTVKADTGDQPIDLYWPALAGAPAELRVRLALDLLSLHSASGTHPDLERILTFVEGTRSPDVEELVEALFDCGEPLERVLSLLTGLLALQSPEVVGNISEKVFARFAPPGSGRFSSQKHAEEVLGLFGVLLRSGKVSVNASRRFCVLLLSTGTPAEGLKLLSAAYKQARTARQQHIALTAVLQTPLVLARCAEGDSAVASALRFALGSLQDLTPQCPSACHRALVGIAAAADALQAESACYELFAHALLVYEEHILELPQQLAALAVAAQALQRTVSLSSTNYDALAHRVVTQAQRLLQKPAQCHALLLAAHLFWDSAYPNESDVLETLQRAMRAAESVMDVAQSVELLVKVLDQHLYFLSNKTPTVTAGEVNNLLELIRATLKEVQDDKVKAELEKRLARTAEFIKTARFEQFEGLHA